MKIIVENAGIASEALWEGGPIVYAAWMTGNGITVFQRESEIEPNLKSVQSLIGTKVMAFRDNHGTYHTT